MRTDTIILASGLAVTVAAAETIHGVLVFTRHGDRTTKHYGNQQLTPLGAQQCFQSGSFYRARYLSPTSPHQISGINPSEYSRAQVYATAPDQDILINTATAFLQGLYPPLSSSSSSSPDFAITTTLENGTTISNYQYVTLHTVPSSSPETFWLKGDESCPAAARAQASYKQSDAYKSLLESTKPFYESMYPYVEQSGAYPSGPASLSYANAYDIFDLVNVASIHNNSSNNPVVKSQDLFRLRTLADSFEFNTNYDGSDPNSKRQVGARSLAGAVLYHLRQTVSSSSSSSSSSAAVVAAAAGTNTRKFTLLAGSYDTFLSWFGLAGLVEVDPNFYGLPSYGATMVFEVFSSSDSSDNSSSSNSDSAQDKKELKVRWLFRNGTDDQNANAELKRFPLFGGKKTTTTTEKTTGGKVTDQDDELTWTEFEKLLTEKGKAIGSAEEWCRVCQSDDDKEEQGGFCRMYSSNNNDNDQKGVGLKTDDDGTMDGEMIAGIVLIVVGGLALVSAAVFWFILNNLRKKIRGQKQQEESATTMAAAWKEKKSFESWQDRSIGDSHDGKASV